MRAFLFDTRAAGAAEFALVLPLALGLLFGIIDVGRYAWQLNEYEKATQMGVRYAVVTDPVTSVLSDPAVTYVGNTSCGDPLRAGDRICAAAFPTIICNSSGCDSGTLNSTAFNNVVGRIRDYQPRVASTQVAVEYRGSGLGFAGDPNKPEVAPIVTVRINNANYAPLSLSLFGATVGLPDFSYSLTLEDARGAASN
ncbi:TadE/TadG family type IV pilus assembly protein [Erythrobacter ani]|nr:TadE/TadG family type IV pilus assembly protein [Erythrobacter ani]